MADKQEAQEPLIASAFETRSLDSFPVDKPVPSAVMRVEIAPPTASSDSSDSSE